MRIFTTITFAVVFAAVGLTQGPPPGGPGGPGGPPPEMRKQFEAMMKWQSAHMNVMRLQGTVMVLPELTKSTKNKPSKVQAQKLLSIINKWKDKKSVTDAQAKEIVKQIRTVLNKDQLKVLDTPPKFGPGPGGPGMNRRSEGRGGPGGPPPGGPPPGQGNGRRPTGPPKMPTLKEFNPLNPSTLVFDFMRKPTADRLNGLISTLKKLAK